MRYQHATQLVIWAICEQVVLMQTLWFLFLEFIFSAKKLSLLKKFCPENLFLLFYHKLLVTTIDLIFLIFLILHILVVFWKQWKVPTSKCIKDHFFCFQKCQCTVFLFFMLGFLGLLLLTNSLVFFIIVFVHYLANPPLLCHFQ